MRVIRNKHADLHDVLITTSQDVCSTKKKNKVQKNVFTMFLFVCAQVYRCLKLCLPLYNLSLEGYTKNWLMLVVSKKDTWE